MNGGVRQVTLGGPQDIEEILSQKCRLSARKANFCGGRIDERYRCQYFLDDPTIINVLGRLRAHEAIMVAALGEEEVVVRRAASVKHSYLVAVRPNAGDIAVRYVCE